MLDAGMLIHTRDGGASWESPLPPASGSVKLRRFHDNGLGLYGENAVLYRSADGLSWRTIRTPPTHKWDAFDFFSSDEGWGIGQLRESPWTTDVIHSSDGGRSWQFVARGLSRSIRGVDTVEGGQAWLLDWEGTITVVESNGNIRETDVARGVLGKLRQYMWMKKE